MKEKNDILVDTVDYRADFILEYMPKLTKYLSIRDILNPQNGESIPLKVAANWVDSVRKPISRPPKIVMHAPPPPPPHIEEYFQNAPKGLSALASIPNLEDHKYPIKEIQTPSGVLQATKTENKYEILTKKNSLWADGCPVAKGELASLWEYNITGKDHISDMFTYLSVNFAPTGNFCSPGGTGRSMKIGTYTEMKKSSDLPYS